MIVPKMATRTAVNVGPNCMAATSHPLASQVALDILKRGGTAVDAAIAANAAIGLMEPTGNGVGGDLFAIVWDAKSGKLHGLNASGRSPQSLSLAQLRAELKKLNRITIPPRGPLPVSVPGTVDGWFELHGKFGKLPMKDLLQPAIDYARNGFPVTEIIAAGWELNARVLRQYPNYAETFLTASAPGTESATRQLRLTVNMKAGQPYEIQLAANVFTSGNAGGSSQGRLSFERLPPGASITSCKGFRQDAPVATLAKSWGALKHLYR